MNYTDVRKYYKPVLGAVALNIAAAILYDLGKNSLIDNGRGWVLLGLTVGISQICYTLFVINYVKSRSHRLFIKRTEALHNFAHAARDLSVKLMARKPEACKHRGKSAGVALSGDSHYIHRAEVQKMLDLTVSIFKSFVPDGTEVWASLRERRSDDHYHTWVRTSNANASRANSSEPLHKKSKTIEHLRYSFEERNDCVIITGSGKEDWQPMRNDRLQEDRCVLMGAVMSRSWNGETFEDPMLNWVLCICADREDVFTKSHINMMKSCNDIFSWSVNSFIRHDALVNNRPPRGDVVNQERGV